jgi:hypothetical protein
MENREVKIEELEVGDEILVAAGGAIFKYLRVLRKPNIGKKLHWHNKTPLYSNVKCSTRQEIVTKLYTNYSGVQSTYEQKEWVATPDDHNINVSIDLQFRSMWLIKRETV